LVIPRKKFQPNFFDDALIELRSVVARAKNDEPIEKSPGDTRSLVRRLLGGIFFLAAKELADILRIPFVLGRKRNDSPDESDENEAAGALLGLPLVVLTTRLSLLDSFPISF